MRDGEALLGPTNTMVALNQRILADALLVRDALGDVDEALTLATSATTILRGLDRDAAIDLGDAEFTRGRALLRSGEPSAAIVALRESLAQLSPRLDKDSPHLAEVRRLLAQALEETGGDERGH